MSPLLFWLIATVMVVVTTAALVVPLFWVRQPGDAAKVGPRRLWSAIGVTTLVPLAALGLYAAIGSPNLIATAPGTNGAPSVAGDDDTTAMAGGDAAAWIAVAEGHRRQREFPQALEAFAQLVKLHAMTADLWADYADAHGAAQGALDDTSAGYIAQALRLDPKHAKALWLLASYQTDRNDYRGAYANWQRLAAVLGPDSPDARIVAANIAEARAKISGATLPPAVPVMTASKASNLTTAAAIMIAQVALRGEVQLDARWRSRVPAGAVLFVFAKEAGASGPPLAVMRTSAENWPISFVLDDSSAMIPSRKLSDFANVVVEARISRSGNALPQRGDLHVLTPALNPRTAGSLKLVIADEIG